MKLIKRTTGYSTKALIRAFSFIFLAGLFVPAHGLRAQQDATGDNPTREQYGIRLDTPGDHQRTWPGYQTVQSDKGKAPELVDADAFGAQQVIQQSTLPSPGHLTTADLDGDGKKDLVVSSRSTDKVVWYRKTEIGFSDQKLVTGGIEDLYEIDAADFSGDGLADLALVTDHHVYYVLNNSGSFTTTEIQDLGDSNYIRSLNHADLDGDGRIDIIIATNSSNGVGYYRNGQDSFGGFIPLYSSDDVDDLAVADFDSDGDKDLVYTDYNRAYDAGKTMWHENQIDSIGQFAQSTITIADSAGAWNVETGDFDDNGEPDIVVSSISEGPKLRVFNNYDGMLYEGDTFEEVEFSYGLLDVKDMDDDGVSEFVFGSYYRGTVQYFNKFYFPSTFWSYSELTDTLDEVSDVVAADFTNDNQFEVAAGAVREDNIIWHKNRGSSFGPPRFLEEHTLGGLSDVVRGDFDSDGDMDIAVSAGAVDKINWYENKAGSLGPPQTITSKAYGVADLQVSDLDDDQDPDLVAALADSNQVVWYENTDSGFSSPKVISGQAENVQSVIAIDLNDDGLPEVFSASPDDSTIAGYENSVNGFKSGQVISDQIPDVDVLYAEDMDLDGDPDLLTAYDRLRDVAWFENTSSGFASHQKIEIGGVPSSFARGNFDDDNQQELIVGMDNDQEGSLVLLDKTQDTVEVAQELADYVRVKHLEVVDYDLDGDDDIIAATGLDNSVILIEQTVFGFGDPKNITRETANAVATVAVDINGDTDPDLFSVSSFDSKLAMYENTLKSTPIAQPGDDIPRQFALERNYPNPFNPSTRIQYRLPGQTRVRLTVYNTLGREVARLVDGSQSAGVHSVEFDASALSSGVYFYRLEAGSFTQTRKMMLMK